MAAVEFGRGEGENGGTRQTADLHGFFSPIASRIEVRSIFGHFVRIFETDSRWLRRALAAGACGLAIAGAIVLQEGAKLRRAETIAVLSMLPAFFLLAGCLLATVDGVRSRIRSGAKVGLLSRVFFGSLSSVWLWFALLLILGFALAVFIGSLMG